MARFRCSRATVDFYTPVAARLVVGEQNNCSFLCSGPIRASLEFWWMIPVGKPLAGDGVMPKRFVYVLRNHDSPPKYYKGLASDVATRHTEHNAGTSRSTKASTGWPASAASTAILSARRSLSVMLVTRAGLPNVSFPL
jgi:hypothetical protein